jgi:drug/metabolite transporter (DMT)-like permease
VTVPAKVYLKILVATFLWGTAFPVAKHALTVYQIPPLAFAGIRFTLAGLLLSIAALLVPKKDSPDNSNAASSNWPRILLIGFFSTSVFYGMFFAGLKRTSAVSASVLDGAGPIISSVLAHFVLHNDRLSPRKTMAFLLGFAGLLVIALARRSAAGAAEISTVGCLLIVFGLVASAIGTMMVITYRGSLGLLRLTGYQMVFGGSLLLMLTVILEKQWHWLGLLNFKFYLAWFWLSFVSATAFRIWYSLVRQYKVTSIAVFHFMNCVWGTSLSLTFLHETFTMSIAVGALLVGSGVALMNSARETHERDPPPEAIPLTSD